MSEIKPDDPRGGPRHVESKVVDDDAVVQPRVPQLEPPASPDAVPAANEDSMVPSSDELQAAKYYAIAFLAVVIPLGFVLLGLVILAFIRSFRYLQ